MDEIEEVNGSYRRCMESPNFFADFYRHFMAKNPAIHQKFEMTDMNHQMTALKNGLQYMIMFASGSHIAATKVDDLCVTHDRNHRSITPEMYDDWMASLIETVKDHDPLFTTELAIAWRSVMSHGILRMKSKF